MAADDKTIYDLVTERFPNGKVFDLLDGVLGVNRRNFRIFIVH